MGGGGGGALRPWAQDYGLRPSVRMIFPKPLKSREAKPSTQGPEPTKHLGGPTEGSRPEQVEYGCRVKDELWL